LAFLHRNYLPSLGVITLIIYPFISPNFQLFRQRSWLLLPYFVILSGILLEVTTVWGNQKLAAELWLLERPESIRAAELTAKQYQIRGDIRTEKRIIRNSYTLNSTDAYITIRRLLTYCDESPIAAERAYRQTLNVLRNSIYNGKAPQLIDDFISASLNMKCPEFSPEMAEPLVSTLLLNPSYSLNKLQSHNLHLILFRLSYLRGDFGSAIENLTTAYNHSPNTETLRLMVETFVSAGLNNEANNILINATSPSWKHPIRRYLHNKKIKEIKKLVISSSSQEG
jgi:hypothetical protein